MNGQTAFKFSTFGPYLGSYEYISYLPLKNRIYIDSQVIAVFDPT